MKNKTGKRRLRSVITWMLWALLVQFILINISAASYGYKLTHLRSSDTLAGTKQPSNNTFVKHKGFLPPGFTNNRSGHESLLRVDSIIWKQKMKVFLK